MLPYNIGVHNKIYKEVKVTESEKILTQIGEYVYTEIDEVNRVEYIKEKDIMTGFTIVMENSKEYTVEIKEKM